MRTIVWSVIVLVTAGCQHLPRPQLEPVPPDLSVPVPMTRPGTGSLWRAELAANYTGLDVRARFPGDLLTIIISEISRGKKDATTEGTSDSSILAKVQAFFGVPQSALGLSGINPEQVVQAETQQQYRRDGETAREGTLTASITVRVLAVDGAGNLRVQGDKIINVNNEDQHIVLTGVVRPVDIRPDNSVQSTRVADARIAYYGYGPVGDKQNAPWFYRGWIGSGHFSRRRPCCARGPRLCRLRLNAERHASAKPRRPFGDRGDPLWARSGGVRRPGEDIASIEGARSNQLSGTGSWWG
jgi:flagellar L-ring protein precursor FlgH